MLIGEYQHNIDAKGRVFIPAKFREDLGGTFIVTKGLDNCLFVYSQEEWKKLEEKILALPLSKSRNLRRFIFSCAVEAEADKQGRILINASLRQHAGLQKDVVIIGVSSHVEIWDAVKWQDTCGEITSESIAEAMDELGF